MREAGFAPDWNRLNFDYNFLILGGGEEARFQNLRDDAIFQPVEIGDFLRKSLPRFWRLAPRERDRWNECKVSLDQDFFLCFYGLSHRIEFESRLGHLARFFT